jgi:hypothetical protein
MLPDIILVRDIIINSIFLKWDYIYINIIIELIISILNQYIPNQLINNSTVNRYKSQQLNNMDKLN